MKIKNEIRVVSLPKGGRKTTNQKILKKEKKDKEKRQKKSSTKRNTNPPSRRATNNTPKMCLSLLTILMRRVFAAALCVHLQGRAEDKTQSSSSKIVSYEASRSALKFEEQRVHNKKKYIQRSRTFTYITSPVASTYALH